MRALTIMIAGVALALAGNANASGSSGNERGEARLAQMLAGRTPGKPVSCITTSRTNAMQVIDGVAVVYDAGKTIYVARPTDPRMLGRNDALVIDRFSPSRLCVQEAMKTVDRYDGTHTGVVFLQDFVPYTK
ncbi:MAG: hypothetical protein ACXWIW_07480 [Croceibacterium sp.]